MTGLQKYLSEESIEIELIKSTYSESEEELIEKIKSFLSGYEDSIFVLEINHVPIRLEKSGKEHQLRINGEFIGMCETSGQFMELLEHSFEEFLA